MIALLALLLTGAPVEAPRPVPPQQESAEIWLVDEVLIPISVAPEQVRTIEPDHSLEAVIARLTRMGIAFERRSRTVPANTLPPEIVTRINGLPEGEPFLLPSPDHYVVVVIKRRQVPRGTVRWTPPVITRFPSSQQV